MESCRSFIGYNVALLHLFLPLETGKILGTDRQVECWCVGECSKWCISSLRKSLHGDTL